MLLDIEPFAQLVIALVLGAALGLERTLAGKQAGMRTFALVSMGSCLFIILSNELVTGSNGVYVDPTRMAAGIVTGIGFLGAGLIIFQQELRGLTTAAALWVCCGIGMAVGFHFYLLATFSMALTLFIFVALWNIEHMFESKFVVPKQDSDTVVEESALSNPGELLCATPLIGYCHGK